MAFDVCHSSGSTEAVVAKLPGEGVNFKREGTKLVRFHYVCLNGGKLENLQVC
jgi:hypothetical protein